MTSLYNAVNGSAATGFSLTTTNGGMSVGNVTITGAGNIFLDAGASSAASGTHVALFVVPGATLTTPDGNIFLENDDVLTGTITLGANTSVSASTAGIIAGVVGITIGPLPDSPLLGAAPPANVNEQDLLGGQVYYGTVDGAGNSITALSPTNNLTANSAPIIFDNGGSALGAGAITLSGNVNINATAGQYAIGSLDLSTTTPLVTLNNISYTPAQFVQELQLGHRVGGALQVNGAGVATGGYANLVPSNLDSSLTALVIPASVTVNLQGGGSGFVVTVLQSPTTTTPVATVAGTLHFAGSGLGQLVAETPMYVQTNTGGIIQADKQLEIDTATLVNNGTIQAPTVAVVGTNGLQIEGTGAFVATTTNLIAPVGTGGSGLPSGTTLRTGSLSFYQANQTFSGTLNIQDAEFTIQSSTITSAGTVTITSQTMQNAQQVFEYGLEVDGTQVGSVTDIASTITVTGANQQINITDPQGSLWMIGDPLGNPLMSTTGGGNTSINITASCATCAPPSGGGTPVADITFWASYSFAAGQTGSVNIKSDGSVNIGYAGPQTPNVGQALVSSTSPGAPLILTSPAVTVFNGSELSGAGDVNVYTTLATVGAGQAQGLPLANPLFAYYGEIYAQGNVNVLNEAQIPTYSTNAQGLTVWTMGSSTFTTQGLAVDNSGLIQAAGSITMDAPWGVVVSGNGSLVAGTSALPNPVSFTSSGGYVSAYQGSITGVAGGDAAQYFMVTTATR